MEKRTIPLKRTRAPNPAVASPSACGYAALFFLVRTEQHREVGWPSSCGGITGHLEYLGIVWPSRTSFWHVTNLTLWAFLCHCKANTELTRYMQPGRLKRRSPASRMFENTRTIKRLWWFTMATFLLGPDPGLFEVNRSPSTDIRGCGICLAATYTNENNILLWSHRFLPWLLWNQPIPWQHSLEVLTVPVFLLKTRLGDRLSCLEKVIFFFSTPPIKGISKIFFELQVKHKGTAAPGEYKGSQCKLHWYHRHQKVIKLIDYKYSPHLFTACIFGSRVISTLAISQSERLQVPLRDSQSQKSAREEPEFP